MYCKKCGSKISKDSNFCDKCGTKVEVEEMEELVDELLEDTMIDIKPSMKKIKEKIKEDKENKVINVDLSDYKPDESDIVIPKKNPLKVIMVIVLLFMIITIGLIFINKNKDKKEEQKELDYQEIIDEYGKTIEDVATNYLLEHEIINEYNEIAGFVKYDKHNVTCENTYINIDGTVYLSKCSIDGISVDEEYGKKKNIITKGSDACRIDYNATKNQIEFYTENTLVSVYECNNYKCDQYKTENFEYNSCLDSIAVIEDGSYKYLYNYKAGQEVIDKLDEIIAVKKDNKYIGFIVKNSSTGKYGYVDTRGIIKLEMKYDSLGLISNGIIYDRGFDLTNDKIVASIDGKYGVIKFSTGETIINFEYDNIYLGANNYYVIKDRKQYYLIDNNGNKIIDKSYDMIFAFDDLLVISEDGALKITDYKGNKIIDDEFATKVDYKEEALNGIFGYNALKDGNNIIIEINSPSDNGYITTKYKYDIQNKKISEIE